MRTILSIEDRLLILKGLHELFARTLRSRKSDKWDEANAIYALANRIRQLRTGRPETFWSSYVAERPKEALKDFNEWIQNLELVMKRAAEQLASFPTSEQ